MLPYHDQPPLASALLLLLQELEADSLPGGEQPGPPIPPNLHFPGLLGQVVNNLEDVACPPRDVFLTADDNSWGPSLPPSGGSVFHDPLDELFPDSPFYQPAAPVDDFEQIGDREDSPQELLSSPECSQSQASLTVSSGDNHHLEPLLAGELTFCSSSSDDVVLLHDEVLESRGGLANPAAESLSPEESWETVCEQPSSTNLGVERRHSNSHASNFTELTLSGHMDSPSSEAPFPALPTETTLAHIIEPGPPIPPSRGRRRRFQPSGQPLRRSARLSQSSAVPAASQGTPLT